MIMSANLPARNDPILFSIPKACAASMVAIRRTFHAGNTVASAFLYLCNNAVIFISLNIMLQLLPGA